MRAGADREKVSLGLVGNLRLKDPRRGLRRTYCARAKVSLWLPPVPGGTSADAGTGVQDPPGRKPAMRTRASFETAWRNWVADSGLASIQWTRLPGKSGGSGNGWIDASESRTARTRCLRGTAHAIFSSHRQARPRRSPEPGCAQRLRSRPGTPEDTFASMNSNASIRRSQRRKTYLDNINLAPDYFVLGLLAGMRKAKSAPRPAVVGCRSDTGIWLIRGEESKNGSQITVRLSRTRRSSAAS